MKVLVTIPHFFNPQNQGDKGGYGSLNRDPNPRIAALTQSLQGLRLLFASPQVWFRYTDQLHTLSANTDKVLDLDIVICTVDTLHLLDRIPVPIALYEHIPVQCEPMFLGFECHRVLKQRLGNYDYYCYMEDDLILHDPLYFDKVSWFNQQAGDGYVLQPNRFEFVRRPDEVKKVYIDLELHTERKRAFAHLYQQQMLGKALGQPVTFQYTSNPHAGCFFLNQRQMEHWAAQEHFLSRDTTFFGPLESAATMGIARTFQVYKPAQACANFLEVQHFGEGWSQKMPDVKFW